MELFYLVIYILKRCLININFDTTFLTSIIIAKIKEQYISLINFSKKPCNDPTLFLFFYSTLGKGKFEELPKPIPKTNEFLSFSETSIGSYVSILNVSNYGIS